MSDRISDGGSEPAPARARARMRDDLEALDGVIALTYERSHIRLNRGKEALIRARLGKRMRVLGHPTLADYWRFLNSPAGEDEITHAINALTTNFTHFLREPEHFQFMVKEALPGLLGPRPRRFAIWSAACATGEEPYTIALHLAEHFPPAAGWDWRILASDISTKALDRAVGGIYPQDKLQDLPRDWLRRHFQQGIGSCAGLCRVKTALRERITFEQRNLLETTPDGCRFEIVFCRNVMIYFDRPTQERLANSLSRVLVPAGYLFTGRAESLHGLAMPLHCLRPSVYQMRK